MAMYPDSPDFYAQKRLDAMREDFTSYWLKLDDDSKAKFLDAVHKRKSSLSSA